MDEAKEETHTHTMLGQHPGCVATAIIAAEGCKLISPSQQCSADRRRVEIDGLSIVQRPMEMHGASVWLSGSAVSWHWQDLHHLQTYCCQAQDGAATAQDCSMHQTVGKQTDMCQSIMADDYLIYISVPQDGLFIFIMFMAR